jgi:hypothetical protein
MATAPRERLSGQISGEWHNQNMPNRSRKKPEKDFNQIAVSIVDQVTGEATPPLVEKPKKNPAAVALGRKGGLKGGKARAAKLTKEQLSESARKAAQARWKKNEA